MRKKFNIKESMDIKAMEDELKDKVNSITTNYKENKIEVDFDESHISEEELDKAFNKESEGEIEDSEEVKKPKEQIEPARHKNKAKAIVHQAPVVSDKDNSLSQKLGWVFVIVAILVIIFIGLKVTGFSINNSSSVGGSNLQGGVQIVKMHVENSQYILEPASVKVGVPVRIEADISKMPGCSKSVVISALNIRKTLSEGNNIIEFTPDKAGTFNIACSMNMYKGTFTVLEASGAKASYVEPANTAARTCGGSSGGGCGGSGGGCGGGCGG